MRWEEYYSKFKNFDWSTSTQINRISKLENYGEPREILEVADDFCDEAAASRLIKKACDAGVMFSAEDIVKMGNFVTEECISHVFKKTSAKFTREQLDELYIFIEEDLLKEKARKQKINLEDDEDFGLEEERSAAAKILCGASLIRGWNIQVSICIQVMSTF